jgi:hypothetical protein
MEIFHKTIATPPAIPLVMSGFDLATVKEL